MALAVGERMRVDAMPDGVLCHHDKQPCVREKCAMWRKIEGRHPQTGEMIERWDCSEAAALNLIDLERNKHLTELIAVMETMRAEHWLATETVLAMTGRQDILEAYRARRDHVRALNRTEELVNERSGSMVPRAKDVVPS